MAIALPPVAEELQQSFFTVDAVPSPKFATNFVTT
jgi:hypothetical protein